MKEVDHGSRTRLPSVSVVIVNWNSGAHLARLLLSLRPSRAEFQNLIVADNASRDGSDETVADMADVTLLRFDHNLGFGEAANRAIAATRSEWILLLNPDIEVIPDSVDRLRRHAADSVSAAIVCGPLLDFEGRPQTRFQIRKLPTPISVLSDALFLDELLRPFRSTGEPVLDAVTEVEQPAAAYWLMRREVWERLGGFDRRFHPAWFEDVDYCRRVRQTGWKIRYFPDCPVRHRGGLSVATLGKSEFYRVFYANLLRYLRKHHWVAFPFLWLPVRLGTWMRLWLIRN